MVTCMRCYRKIGSQLCPSWTQLKVCVFSEWASFQFCHCLVFKQKQLLECFFWWKEEDKNLNAIFSMEFESKLKCLLDFFVYVLISTFQGFLFVRVYCCNTFITAQHPPWRHWFNDAIPPYTRPPDRRTAREEREAERERMGQVQRDAQHQLRERDLANRKYVKYNDLDLNKTSVSNHKTKLTWTLRFITRSNELQNKRK